MLATRMTISTNTVDAAAILSSIWAKNALRREVGGLPLWPVQETFERELRQAHWKAHLDRHYVATRARVVADLRAHYGVQFGGSPGGRWAIEARTAKALRASFRIR